MVGADELSFETLAGYTVDDVAIDLAVTIDHTVLAREMFVLAMNVEGVWLLLCGPQFAAQVFVVRPESELIGVLRVVAEPIVDVVVRDTGAGAEGNLATEVGEEIQSVVVMMLRDGQLAVQYKPMDEVRQLAHAATDTLRGLTLGDGQSLLVAFPLGRASNESPDGERLARTNQQPVDVLHRQSQVRSLVLLQQHVHVAQPTTNQRVVAIDHHGERLLLPLLSELRLPYHIQDVALQDFLLHRQPIGKGRYFAKKFSFHVLSLIKTTAKIVNFRILFVILPSQLGLFMKKSTIITAFA